MLKQNLQKSRCFFNYQQHKGPSIPRILATSRFTTLGSGRTQFRVLRGVKDGKGVSSFKPVMKNSHSPLPKKGESMSQKWLNLCQGFLGWNDIFCQEKSFVNIIQLVIWKSVLRVRADPPPFFYVLKMPCVGSDNEAHTGNGTHWKQVKGIQSYYHCNWLNSYLRSMRSKKISIWIFSCKQVTNLTISICNRVEGLQPPWLWKRRQQRQGSLCSSWNSNSGVSWCVGSKLRV